MAYCSQPHPELDLTCRSDEGHRTVHIAFYGDDAVTWGEPQIPVIEAKPKARRTDPQSSHEAAARNWDVPSAATLLGRVWMVLEMGTRGETWMTATEVERAYVETYGPPEVTSNRGFQAQDKLLTLHRQGSAHRLNSNPLRYRSSTGLVECYEGEPGYERRVECEH